MSDPVSNFFGTWQLDSAEARLDILNNTVSEHVSYADPRTTDTVNGIAALNDYVGMFSANAPGWSAKVVDSTTTAGMTRATVAFGGTGPDGNDMVQLGQYFVETDNGLISRMVGFVGTGTPD